MLIQQTDINQFESRYRTTFVNSLAGFKQAVLVGSVSGNGHANLAIFNSLIHLGANPALFGFISRPDTVERHTLQHILDTGSYTFNYVKASLYQQAHQTSARYGRGVSEFDAVGFSAQYMPPFRAPFVQEAVVKIAMQYESSIEISLNGTFLVIGSIRQVWLDEVFLQKDGFVDLQEQDVLLCQGLDAYFTARNVGRLPYPKP